MLFRTNTEPRIDTQLALFFDTELDCEVSFLLEVSSEGETSNWFVYRCYRAVNLDRREQSVIDWTRTLWRKEDLSNVL